MNVTRLDDRRPIACQWCDKPVATIDLAAHLRDTCPALAARRQHPSNWKAGA